MLTIVKNSQGSVIIRFKILNNSNGLGQGLTGLTYSSSGLIIGTVADNEASSTSYTSAGSTIETITTLGTYAAPTATKCRFKEVDSTNHPGLYELQLADARFAVSSAKSLLVTVSGAANASDADFVIPLWTFDPYASVTQTGDSYSRIGTAGAGLTALGDTRIAHLDADISSRSTYAGGAVASVMAGVTLATSQPNYAPSIAGDKMDLIDAPNATALTAFFTKILTTALTESYAADGAAPTLAQFMFMLLSKEFEMSISGTTLTCKKLDGTTTAMTFTLNSATAPTAITRAT